jgi:hypothetical protein
MLDEDTHGQQTLTAAVLVHHEPDSISGHLFIEYLSKKAEVESQKEERKGLHYFILCLDFPSHNVWLLFHYEKQNTWHYTSSCIVFND